MGTGDRGDWQTESDQASETANWIFDNARLIVLLAILAAELVWVVSL